MKKWMLIIITVSALFVNQSLAQVKDGTYVNGSYSSIKITTKNSQQQFVMEVIGANGHMCDAEGIIKGDKGFVTDDSEATPCELSFKANGSRLNIETQNEVCRNYCGARASLDGEYRMPPKLCEAKSITQQRSQFKIAYDAKQYEKAENILNRLLTQCDFYLYFEEKDSIKNDLALTLYHQNKADLCLEILKETIALDSDAYLPPADQMTYEKTEKAILFNYGLCQKKQR